jgi:hypothetical protein
VMLNRCTLKLGTHNFHYLETDKVYFSSNILSSVNYSYYIFIQIKYTTR